MPLEFTVIQSDLVRELALAQGSVEKKTTQPLLQHVLFTAKPTGSVSVTATDHALSYQGSIPATVAQPGSIAIMADTLQSWARDFRPDALIKLKEQANGWIRVSCERNFSTIRAIPGNEFPSLPMPTDPIATFPSDVLLSSLQIERISVGDDPLKLFTNGVLIEIHPGVGMRMVATNIHTMAMTDKAFDMDVSPEEFTKFLLPDKAMAELARLIPIVGGEGAFKVPVYLGRNSVSFGLRDSVFTARLLETRYPDYTHCFSDEGSHRILIPAASLKQALYRVGLFANESNAVDLTFNEDGLCVVATSSGKGAGEETIDVNYSGDAPVKMRVNAKYLNKFIAKAGNEPIEIIFGDDMKTQKMIEWRIVDDPTFRFVVGTMAIQEDESTSSTNE